MESLVANGKPLPLTRSAIIDRDEILKQIDLLRAAIPEEVRAAKRINAEGERIMEKANEEADRILARAQEQAAFLIGERGLTQAAEAESGRIVGQAQEDADEVRRGADEYAVQVLLTLEGEVVRTLQGIKKGVAVLDERRAELRDAEAAEASATDQSDDEYDTDAVTEEDEAADAAPSGRR